MIDDDGDDNYDDNGNVSSAVLGVPMLARYGGPSCCDGGDGIQVLNLTVNILNNQ
jgi:hypothetical protein